MTKFKIYDDPPKTVQMVPAGFEKLSDLRDRMGAANLLGDLQAGAVTAFEFITDDGRKLEIGVDDWASSHGPGMVEHGHKSHYFSPELPIDPANAREVFWLGEDKRLILVKIAGEKASKLPVATTAVPSSGRPYGTGLEAADAPLIEQMRGFMLENNLRSATAAARRLFKTVQDIPGGGTYDVKIKRLVRRYKKKYGKA